MEKYIRNLFFVTFTIVVIILYLLYKNSPTQANENDSNPNQVTNIGQIAKHDKLIKQTGINSNNFLNDIGGLIFGDGDFQTSKVSSEFVDRTLQSLINNASNIKNTLRMNKENKENLD